MGSVDVPGAAKNGCDRDGSRVRICIPMPRWNIFVSVSTFKLVAYLCHNHFSDPSETPSFQVRYPKTLVHIGALVHDLHSTLNQMKTILNSILSGTKFKNSIQTRDYR